MLSCPSLFLFIYNLAAPIHIIAPLSTSSLVLPELKGVSLLGTDAQGLVQGVDVTGGGMDWLADTQVTPLLSMINLYSIYK